MKILSSLFSLPTCRSRDRKTKLSISLCIMMLILFSLCFYLISNRNYLNDMDKGSNSRLVLRETEPTIEKFNRVLLLKKEGTTEAAMELNSGHVNGNSRLLRQKKRINKNNGEAIDGISSHNNGENRNFNNNEKKIRSLTETKNYDLSAKRNLRGEKGKERRLRYNIQQLNNHEIGMIAAAVTLLFFLCCCFGRACVQDILCCFCLFEICF